MTRNLKALGLALVAVLALGAMAASSAQAQLKVTTSGKTWLTTTDTISNHTYTVPGGAKIECKVLHGQATVENNQTEVTLSHLSYTECSSTVGPATVTMEGCDYLFHGGETDPNDSTHGIKGTVDLICPPEKKPVIHIYTSAANHASNTALCTLTVNPFTNKGEITYTNTPETSGSGIPNDFDLKAIEVPTTYTRHGSILCGAASGEAKYNGQVTVTGFKDEGFEADGTTPKEGARTGVTIS